MFRYEGRHSVRSPHSGRDSYSEWENTQSKDLSLFQKYGLSPSHNMKTPLPVIVGWFVD